MANLPSNLLGTFVRCGLIRSPAGPTVDDEALTFGLTFGLSVAVLLPAPNLGPPVRLTSTLVFVGGLPREVLTFLRLILALVEGLDSALNALATGFLASVFLASGFSLAGFAGLSLESLRLCRSFCFGLSGLSGFKVPALLPFFKDLTSLDTFFLGFLVGVLFS